jgi:hypothetical protein
MPTIRHTRQTSRVPPPQMSLPLVPPTNDQNPQALPMSRTISGETNTNNPQNRTPENPDDANTEETPARQPNGTTPTTPQRKEQTPENPGTAETSSLDELSRNLGPVHRRNKIPQHRNDLGSPHTRNENQRRHNRRSSSSHGTEDPASPNSSHLSTDS